MLYYVYYGYLAYSAYRYSYLLEYGYLTIHYAGKIYTRIAPKGEDSHEIEGDWVLCEVDEPSVLVLDDMD